MFRRSCGALLIAALLLSNTGFSAAAQDVTPALNWPDLTLIPFVEGLTRPVHITDPSDGSGRLFIVEKAGVVHILQHGQLLSTPFLDIRDRVNSSCHECGLLSIVFPPNDPAADYFFVYYTAKENLAPPSHSVDADAVIARFFVGSGDPNVADAATETRILVQDQPYTNHNGGLILFGPDGYLYAGLGDGGGGGDPDGNAQNPGTLLGKMLRIEVGASGDYTVPADNPFVGLPGYRSEIWAEGLRNPWRFSFDRLTGDLWIGDVGQGRYEEVNLQPAGSTGGQNYGWNQMEGRHCYPADACDPALYTLPIYEYNHGPDCSITGGYVYHSPNPDQPPVYLMADYCSGRIRGLQRNGAIWESILLLEAGSGISGFGEDAAGRLYLVDIGSGAADGVIFRIMDRAAQHHIFVPFFAAPLGID